MRLQCAVQCRRIVGFPNIFMFLLLCFIVSVRLWPQDVQVSAWSGCDDAACFSGQSCESFS